MKIKEKIWGSGIETIHAEYKWVPRMTLTKKKTSSLHSVDDGDKK